MHCRTFGAILVFSFLYDLKEMQQTHMKGFIRFTFCIYYFLRSDVPRLSGTIVLTPLIDVS